MQHTEGTYILPYIDGENKFTPVVNMRSSIFLAGPCPRENYGEDWRFEAATILRRLGFKGNIREAPPTSSFPDFSEPP